MNQRGRVGAQPFPFDSLTERGGFELPEPFGSSDFKSDAIDHSATSPDVFFYHIKVVEFVTTNLELVGSLAWCDRTRTCSEAMVKS